ncbi:MAG TPA: proprotein convertase P-domain-containing protein, partial [Myxococcota bacterium]|nr:proprotein convertase P-domain-containing protein [Myxococcota bacterium]
WVDSTDSVRILVHDTGGDGTQYENQIFPFAGTVNVFLPPPDVSWTLDAPVTVPSADPPDSFATVTMALDGPDGCTVGELYLDYTQDPQGFTYNNEVEYVLTSPTGTEVVLGRGTAANGNIESGRFNGTLDFAGEAVDGNWQLLIEDTYGDGVAVSNLVLSVYCAE